jgi:DNA modification methylase
MGPKGDDKTLHPTQKPIELWLRPIRNHLAPGQALYDPFAGSGTAVIAAHQVGRVAYAMDIDPTYVDVICRRYQEHTGTKPVLEAAGEPHDFTA